MTLTAFIKIITLITTIYSPLEDKAIRAAIFNLVNNLVGEFCCLFRVEVFFFKKDHHVNDKSLKYIDKDNGFKNCATLCDWFRLVYWSQWGSISPRWQHFSRMMACFVLIYLKIFLTPNESFFIQDKCRHLRLCLSMMKPINCLALQLGN